MEGQVLLQGCSIKERLDAVIIGTPNNFHRNQTIAAATHGIHILLEKPMAVTNAEAWEMVEAAKRNHVKLMAGCEGHQTRRSSPYPGALDMKGVASAQRDAFSAPGKIPSFGLTTPWPISWPGCGASPAAPCSKSSWPLSMRHAKSRGVLSSTRPSIRAAISAENSVRTSTGMWGTDAPPFRKRSTGLVCSGDPE